MAKNRHSFTKAPSVFDEDEQLDPLEMRHVLAALDTVRERHPRIDLTAVYDAISVLDLFPSRKSPFAQFANGLMSMGVAVNRGELLRKDPETQEPICADALQELSDECGKLAAGRGIPQGLFPPEDQHGAQEG